MTLCPGAPAFVWVRPERTGTWGIADWSPALIADVAGHGRADPRFAALLCKMKLQA